MPTVPDIHRRGTRAAQAAATALTIGTLWFVVDEGVTERWNGTVWESWSADPTGPIPYLDLSEGVPVDPPADTARLYSLDVNGYTAVEVCDAGANVVRLASDNVVVGKVTEAAGVARGQVLYIAGAAGANPLLQLAKSDDIATMPGIGVALDPGALNAFVRVLVTGTIQAIDTSAWAEGVSLFVSATTAGAFTTTLPAAPAYAQRIGFVTRSHATQGEVLVMTTGVDGPPRLHAAAHQAAGTDPLALDTLAAPTDVTTLNATAGAHGLLPKLSGVATDVLKGDGSWAAPAAAAAHAASHASGGGDPVTVTGLAGFPGGATTYLRDDGTFATPPGGAPTTAQLTRTLTFLFDNGASDLAAATQTLPVSCPYAGTITAARLLSPQTGAIVLDVWKDVFASYPPTVADTITAAAKPTLSAANKVDVTLTGWTTAVAAGDVFLAKVDSCTGIHACTLQLTLVVA